MSSAAERLGHYLDKGYAAIQLSQGSANELVKTVKDRLAAEQELMDAAKEKMKSYTPALLKKDHISRVHKEFLEKVLMDE